MAESFDVKSPVAAQDLSCSRIPDNHAGHANGELQVLLGLIVRSWYYVSRCFKSCGKNSAECVTWFVFTAL